MYYGNLQIALKFFYVQILIQLETASGGCTGTYYR